jgi:hypothetical protein
MTTNMSEVFNFILKGIHSLPISGIVDYTFHKYNEYFVSRWEKARQSLEKGNVGGVTPRVSNPHDYVNQMFKRP